MVQFGRSNLMIYVVEIESPTGAKASKEYDAPSMTAAVRAIERDLSRYPKFRVIDIRAQDERDSRISDEAW
jgi:hypothetical protein